MSNADQMRDEWNGKRRGNYVSSGWGSRTGWYATFYDQNLNPEFTSENKATREDAISDCYGQWKDRTEYVK